MSSILPPNSTELELACEATIGYIFDAIQLEIRNLWDPVQCPEQLLAWLAWAYSVDEWNPTWPVEIKRQVIHDSFFIHATKGTPASIRRVMASVGYGEVIIVEGTDHWARYSISLQQPITNSQAEFVRRLLDATAPARCELDTLNFTGVTFRYDGEIEYDGTYSYGEAA